MRRVADKIIQQKISRIVKVHSKHFPASSLQFSDCMASLQEQGCLHLFSFSSSQRLFYSALTAVQNHSFSTASCRSLALALHRM